MYSRLAASSDVIWLGPSKGGAKAYHLLARALEQSGKAALARYAARGKQYLVLIRPRSGRLVMQQLLYADEVRAAGEVPLEEAKLSDAEVQLALKLIEQTASDGFHPERYEDAVKARVKDAIDRKVAGEQIQVAAPEPQAQVIDLMEALKASLAAAGGAPAAEAKAAPAPPAHASPSSQGAPANGAARKPAKSARPREERAAKAGSRK